MDSLTATIAVIISIFIIVSFFLISSRIKSILNILITLKQMERNKPENWFKFPCPKCSNNIQVLRWHDERTLKCPHCKEKIEVPDMVK